MSIGFARREVESATCRKYGLIIYMALLNKMAIDVL